MALVPFSLELTSRTSISPNFNAIHQILADITTDHLNSVISKKNQGSWNTLSVATSLKIPKIELVKLDQQQQQTLLLTSFSGSLSFNRNTNLPTEEDIQDVQWEAFIGQSKLDYMTNLRFQSSLDFLKNVTDIKISWSPTSNSGVGSILVAVLIGILSAAAVVICYIIFQKYRHQTETDKSTPKNDNRNHPPSIHVKRHKMAQLFKMGVKQTNHDIHDLELAETGSLSPTAFEGDFAPAFVDETDSIRMGRSVKTRDTIDIDTRVDMLAWKHSAMRQPEPFEADITRISKSDVPSIVSSDIVGNSNRGKDVAPKRGKLADDVGNVPFDADITRISKVSPNKTLVIDLRPMRKGRKSKQSSSLRTKSSASKEDFGYLSRKSLSKHNQIEFQDRNRRY
jgi:hypothetical protein